MRLVPPTWTGKAQALTIIPPLAALAALVVTVLFWPVMSFVLAALFAFYGALIAALTVGFAVYLGMRRTRFSALREHWQEAEADPRTGF